MVMDHSNVIHGHIS